MKIVKIFLLAVFLYNIGAWEGVHDFLTKNFVQVEKSAKNEALSRFVSMKVRDADKKVTTRKHYSEEEYLADMADIFRKMMELGLKPQIPTGLNVLRSFYLNGQALPGKHDEITKVIYNPKNKDIQQYFLENSAPLIEKNFVEHLPSWLKTMYFKNLLLALVFLLLECRANKIGLRNPVSFALLLAFYPVVFGFLFYKYMRIQLRSFVAEVEYRRTKEKLFTFLSKDEMAQIKKFAHGAASLKHWREGLVLRHSFSIALVATLVILVIPKPGQAMNYDSSEKIVVQTAQHLARMEIENDDKKSGENSIDFAIKFFISKICDLLVAMPVFKFRNPPQHFCFQEVFFRIDHIPVSRMFNPMA